jgi:CHAT domain-containing protein/tetratricopeptide (TPR) repeat protein
VESTRHLNPEELEWLSGPNEADRAAERSEEQLDQAKHHLAGCERCQRLVRMHGEIQSSLKGLAATGTSRADRNCPPFDRWERLAAGLLSKEEECDLIDHSGECDACAQVLRRVHEDFTDAISEEETAVLGTLTSSQSDWQEATARQMGALSKRERVGQHETPLQTPSYRRSWSRVTYAYAAAAALVLACTGFWLYRTRNDRSPERLLAEAYAARRTIELRIEAAEYSPMRQERGSARSALKKPSSLLRAELEISEQMAARPEDADVLAAKGRAELLEWQYDEAIKSLRHAVDLNPRSTGVLCDLATAFVERGDAENRPTDYGQALEYLGQALQKEPENKVALFNRAIVEERLNLVEEAQKDWEHYVRIDPQGKWANEARQRLETLQQKVKQGLALPRAEPNASRAVVVLESAAGSETLGSRVWEDSLDEEYMDLAVKGWLPDLAKKAPASWDVVLQTAEGSALEALARALVSRHHDNWLADVLAAPLSPNLLAGWQELALAARFNEEGDFDAASLAAGRAETLLRERSQPAFVRALWERAYALQRAQQGATCMRAIEQAGETPESIPYPWLAAQFHLERAICSAMLGRMGETQRDARTAVSIAESANYGTLQLRTYHIMGIQAASQDPEQAWMWFLKGLQRHWAGTYQPFRVYQFYAEMCFAAESARQWHLARTLMAEAVTHIARTANHLTEAVARHSLAVDAQMAGFPEEALVEFRRAADLFSSLRPTPSVNALLFSAQVYQASLLAEQGQDAAALEALQTAKQHFSQQSQYWVWLHYYQALGEVLLHRGNTDGAEHALHAAVHVSESALATIRDETDRLFWERQTMRAYRSLVELEFEKKHDPERALELWEWYVSAPARAADLGAREREIDFGTLESDPPLPRLDLVAGAIPELKHSTVVSFARLNGRTVAWIFDDRGIEGTRLDVPAEELDLAVRRFVRLCSDPSSNLAEIRQLGRRLYAWMVAPVEARLDPSRILILETDEVLHEVPFAALVTSRGDFLAERYTLVNSPGLGYWLSLRPEVAFSSQDRALAVGSSSSGVDFRKVALPALSDSDGEARDVSLSFADSRLLLGNQATIDAVKRDLPAVRVFHFAGHAITSSTHSGLLLAASSSGAGEEGSTGFLDAMQVARLPLKTVDLVVLSACATDEEGGAPVSPRGLVRGFLRGGVPDVIASRWDVDSHATRLLMQEFYKNLVAGRLPPTALKLASDVIRKRPETTHPYYWAAFGAFGRG